jgi:DNA-binding response OmpR family regulator
MADQGRMADAVLVVEDDASLRDLIAQQLHLAGFAPATAPNGFEALNLLRMGFPAKLILLDLKMPIMDGWAFRAAQRRDPDLADIPVIVMTGRDATGIDAAAVFHKPFDGQEIINAARAICATYERRRAGIAADRRPRPEQRP